MKEDDLRVTIIYLVLGESSNLSWSPHIKFVCSTMTRKSSWCNFPSFLSRLLNLFFVCINLLLFPICPTVLLSGLLLLPLVMLAPSKMFNSSLSNSVLKTGLPAIPLYSHLLVSPPSLLVAIILN